MYQEFGISKELQKIAIESEKELQTIFEKINEISLKNSQKVLMAFQKNKVSEMHFGTSTGYGEGDVRKRLHRRNFYRSFRRRRFFS
jgi:cystathionine beta-lyase family protein involved in aluminum resistance